MAEVERSNFRQIEALNQRGGRTLSIVDVMRAGTITPEAAGFLLWRVAHGASFLTGAVPGGAGKSTLLADLLAMLPPGERIVTTPDDRAVTQALRETPRNGRCYLCHEVGSGHWYGYLWGTTVGRFLQLAEDGGRVAACLHADDPVQMREILLSPTLGVTREAFGKVGILLFMAFDRSAFSGSRVVDSIWAADGEGEHCLAYKREGTLRESEWVRELASEAPRPALEACQAFMARLAEGSAHLSEAVREETVAFYERET
ncbi:MAG: hypothetical protein FJX75_19065 [Armatimonadetes bacterium]|nr:hypothetical protein [Armatimonadota bacterium]